MTGEAVWNDSAALDVAVRIRGAHSRKFPKKSLQLDFVGEPLPDGPPEGHSVRRIHVNADYIDPTLMRSALSYSLFSEVGVPAPRWRHVELAVNGEYFGLYVALESVDRDFCKRRGWAPGPIYYAVNRNANFGLVSPFNQALKDPLDQGYKPVDRADTAPLRRMLMDLNIASDRAFPGEAERWIDTDNYLGWLMIAVFVGNRDGFVHNYALCRNPESGCFRMIPWDYDATWGIDIHGRPARLDRVPLTGWNKLTWRILGVSRYRQLYQRRFRQALIEGVLSPERLNARIDKFSEEVATAVDRDQQRQGLDRSFEEGVAALKSWAQRRRDLLLSQLDRL